MELEDSLLCSKQSATGP